MRVRIVCGLLLMTALSVRAAEIPDNLLAELEGQRRTVAALMEEATIWVVGENGRKIRQGSGFVVAAGVAVTNAHVVEGFGEDAVFHVLNDKLPATRAEIVAVDSRDGGDFALLRFTPPAGVALPALTFNLDAKRMDRVSAWGYPAMVTKFDRRTANLGDGITRDFESPPVVYTEGVVNSLVSGKLGDAIIHSAQIAGGNSGGPLVNRRGEVVGINTWGYKERGEGAFLNAALLANDLVVFLTANGVRPTLVPGQRAVARSGVAAAREDGERPDDADPETRIRTIGPFKVKVPEEWSVVGEEEDTLTLGSDDDAVAVAILVLDKKGWELEELAGELAKSVGAEEPDFDEDNECYTFLFTKDEVQYVGVVVDMDDDRFIHVIVGGDMEDPGLEELFDGLVALND